MLGIRISKNKKPENKKGKGMTTIKWLGVIGGILGLFPGVYKTLFFWLLSTETTTVVERGDIISGIGMLLMAILGIVGGEVAERHPPIGSTLMLIGGVAGAIIAAEFIFPAGMVLVIGGILGLVRSRKKQEV